MGEKKHVNLVGKFIPILADSALSAVFNLRAHGDSDVVTVPLLSQ